MGAPAARPRRRGRGEGSIYKDEAKGRWYAAVSFGYGPDGTTWRRQKVSGRTRAEVAAKLRELHAEHDPGAQRACGYTSLQGGRLGPPSAFLVQAGPSPGGQLARHAR